MSRIIHRAEGRTGSTRTAIRISLNQSDHKAVFMITDMLEKRVKVGV